MRLQTHNSLITESMIRSLALETHYDNKLGYYSDHSERYHICSRLLEKYSTLEGVPGFYQDASGQWTFVGKPGMLIPLYDIDGNLYTNVAFGAASITVGVRKNTVNVSGFFV